MVNADYTVSVEIIKSRAAVLHIDGQEGMELSTGDTIVVSRHVRPLRLCHPTILRLLRHFESKLHWENKMLLRLALRNFVLIDETEIEFDDGFCAFTGETGAGKSLLVGALSLLAGGRAPAGLIKAAVWRRK